jgi:lyso-ornithine lipid O-acyltransferase
MTRLFRTSRRLIKLALAINRARRESATLGDAMSRALWQQRQAQRMLAALEVEVSIHGDVPTTGLVVCNHLSYVDVLVLAAQGPFVFIAKSDVRSWPVIGHLLESAGTILAERERPLTAGKTAAQIGDALNQGIPVILFPEGTSSDGSTVLPFKPTLLQAALDANATITPAAIFYQVEMGDAANEVCYWGDATFFPHLVRLAGIRKVAGVVHFGMARNLSTNRKAAASELHDNCLGLLNGIKSR